MKSHSQKTLFFFLLKKKNKQRFIVYFSLCNEKKIYLFVVKITENEWGAIDKSGTNVIIQMANMEYSIGRQHL